MSTLTRGISGSIHQVYDSESDEIACEGYGTVASLGPGKDDAEREAAPGRLDVAKSCSPTEPTARNSDVFPGEHN